jgi:hypothetical protein
MRKNLENFALFTVASLIAAVTAFGALGINPGEAHHSKDCESTQSLDAACARH